MAINAGWGGEGWGRKPISEMSVNPLQPQEEKAKHYNDLNDIRVRPGKPPAKGALASYRQKDLENVAGELVPPPHMGKSKKRCANLPKIEREGEREIFYHF